MHISMYMPPYLHIYCLSDFFRIGKCFRSHICIIQSDMHGYTLAIPLLYHCVCLLRPISSISLVYTSYMAYIMIEYVLYALECPSRHFSLWYISVYFIYRMLYHVILAYQNAIPLYTNWYRPCARICTPHALLLDTPYPTLRCLYDRWTVCTTA